MHSIITRITLSGSTEIAPEDVLDCVKTLTPKNKILVQLPFPGEGPDHFLNWARDELAEEESALDESPKRRKAFNVSVLSKCAVECLVDWYLSKHLLDLTIKPYCGLVQKLEALKAEERLGIGLALFNDVIFQPRNDAIHYYEQVDPARARMAYELANLTIKNCRNTESPKDAPVYYGSIEVYQDKDADKMFLQLAAVRKRRKGMRRSTRDTSFAFVGVGDRDETSVFIDRNGKDSRIVLLTSQGDGNAEVRFCPISNHFTTEGLRELFHNLDGNHPAVLDLRESDVSSIISTLSRRDA
jgi:hypothetical protein